MKKHSALTGRILYVSRGRGHAMQDLAIAAELKEQAPLLRITFASYDIGNKVLLEAGVEVCDLALPERNPFAETVLRNARIIEREVKPILVISHEELAALTAAKINRVQTLFPTHWFSIRRTRLCKLWNMRTQYSFSKNTVSFPNPHRFPGKRFTLARW
jgi:hypothetical protein